MNIVNEFTKPDDKTQTEQAKEKNNRTPPTSRDSSYDTSSEKGSRRGSVSISSLEVGSSQIANMKDWECQIKTLEQQRNR